MSESGTPIPVFIARGIGERLAKSIVLVVAYDPVFDMLHTATWGKSPDDKIHAAALGDRVTQFIGGDLSKRETFEDFRTRAAAEATKRIEDLADECNNLRDQLAKLRRERGEPC